MTTDPEMPEVVPGSPADRLYTAELAAFYEGRPGTVRGLMRVRMSWADVVDYVDDVLADSLVRDRWPGLTATPVPEKFGPGAYTTGKGEIHLPPAPQGPIYLLHEIAHRATMKFVEDEHGPEFCGVYLVLLRRFVGAPAEHLLRRELARRDVRPSDRLVDDHPARRMAA